MIDSFGSGKAPFAITGPWADQPGRQRVQGDRRARTPCPRSRPATGGEAPQVFVGVQGFMISSFSEQKDLAKSFVLDFMSQEPTQLALFEAGGRPPALTSAFDQVKRRSRRRRLRRVRRRRHPAAGDPGDEQRLDVARPGRGQRAARRRSDRRVHGRGGVDPHRDRRLTRDGAGCPGARRRSGTGTRSPRRRAPRGRDPGTASGWIAKIVLLGLVDALAITGLAHRVGPGGVGLRRRARRHAGRPQRGVPAAALRADEVPAAGALLPRRVRRVPGAVHGVRVDDELRHRLRAQPRRRRSTRSRASRSAAPRASTAYDVTPLRGPDGRFAGYGLYDPETERALPRHRQTGSSVLERASPSCRC